MIGNDEYEGEGGGKAMRSSRGKGARRSKAEYAADQRARDEFLDRLGFADDWTRQRYHANQLVRPRIGDPLSYDNLLGLLNAYRDDQFGRLRSMPGWTAVWHRLRKVIRSRVKVTSDVFETIGKDADAATDALLVQTQVVAELQMRLVEEAALLSVIEVHRRGLLRHEVKAVSAMPAQVITAARLLELHGLNARFKPGAGDEFSGELVALLNRYSRRSSVNTEVEGRLARRLSSEVEVMDLNSEETEKWDFDASYGTWIPEEQYELIAPSQHREVYPQTDLRAGRQTTFVETSIEESVPKPTIVERAAYGRASGHGRIFDLADDEAFAGVVPASGIQSGFEDIDPHAVSMQSRDNPNLAAVRNPYDQTLDGHAWSRFEVPAAPYTLCHVLGPSPWLPLYQPLVSMPPFVELAQYGRMLGRTPSEIEDLSRWDSSGHGPAHLRPHAHGEKFGDPDLAFEVMKCAVATHHNDYSIVYNLREITEEEIDIRFWIFLTAGRMRPGTILDLWGEVFFDDVAGHDPLLKDRGHWVIRRT